MHVIRLAALHGVARRRQTKIQNSSSTFPTTTGIGSDVILPHDTYERVCMSALTEAHVQNIFVSSDTQASPALSDVFARLECELNRFHPPSKHPRHARQPSPRSTKTSTL